MSQRGTRLVPAVVRPWRRAGAELAAALDPGHVLWRAVLCHCRQSVPSFSAASQCDSNFLGPSYENFVI